MSSEPFSNLAPLAKNVGEVPLLANTMLQEVLEQPAI